MSNANGRGQFHPPRRAHCKGVAASLSQKGVEFDPFKVGVVQLLPKSTFSGYMSNHKMILSIYQSISYQLPKMRKKGDSDFYYIYDRLKIGLKLDF